MATKTVPDVRLAPPPARLMRMVNPLVRVVLTTSPIARHIRLQGMIEFTGRRSGRTLRVPVCLHDIGGDTLVFTERPWRHNFASGAPVTVRQQGRLRHGRALLLDATPAEVGAALRAALDAGATPFELGLKVRRGYQPTATDLAAIARGIIRIEFDD